MAYTTLGYCIKCKREFTTVVTSERPTPNICNNCQAEESEIEKEVYFIQLNKLSLEERVRKIEEWIYSYQPFTIQKF